MLIGESNYSDAHLFPVAYKLKGVGKTLGMPVPGTGTFVWWEKQIDPALVFGIPMGGWRTPDGKFCENNQLEPDIKVRNEPDVMSGRTRSTDRGGGQRAHAPVISGPSPQLARSRPTSRSRPRNISPPRVKANPVPPCPKGMPRAGMRARMTSTIASIARNSVHHARFSPRR